MEEIREEIKWFLQANKNEKKKHLPETTGHSKGCGKFIAMSGILKDYKELK
jgi:hypothetical protein